MEQQHRQVIDVPGWIVARHYFYYEVDDTLRLHNCCIECAAVVGLHRK